MNKVFIVEDDENIRDLILYALKANNFEAIGFECASDFFSELKTTTPDIVILDVMLPDTNGLSILSTIRTNSTINTIPIIMLTAKSSEYDKVKGLDLGADDYITKPFSVLELISRINALLRRTNAINKNIITFKNLILDEDKHVVKLNNSEINLTLKEFELLNLLITNIGYVFSRDKIMEKVWGFDYEGESRTVDMHITSLRKKLGTDAKIIETVRGIGYKIGE